MLEPLFAVIGAATLIFAVVGLRSALRTRRRRKLRSEPIPAAWRAVVEYALPVYRRVPADLRTRLDGLIQQFIAEKEFIGCQGLTVTLEMKLAVAAPACLLIVNRTGKVYEELYSILLYPTAFIVPQEDHDDAGVVTTHESVLTGEAWETHRIVLSWEDIQAGAQGSNTGYNVVLHEFAHYLDAEDGGAQSEVMNTEFETLRAAADRGEDTVLDPYGAEDPAEFFAVATETFFELPVELKQKHPALYAELAAYYRLDPAMWLTSAETSRCG